MALGMEWLPILYTLNPTKTQWHPMVPIYLIEIGEFLSALRASRILNQKFKLLSFRQILPFFRDHLFSLGKKINLLGHSGTFYTGHRTGRLNNIPHT